MPEVWRRTRSEFREICINTKSENKGDVGKARKLAYMVAKKKMVSV